MFKQTKYRVIEPLLLSAMVVIGMMVGKNFSDNNSGNSLLDIHELNEEIATTGRVEEIIRFIESRYVDEVESDELVEEAIYSIFGTLDPHSNYIPQRTLNEINEDMSGEYLGVGIETLYYNDTVFVEGVLPDSPGENCGLKRGDKILAIDKVSVAGTDLSYAEISAHFDKEKGAEVEVVIERDDKELKLDCEINVIPRKAVPLAYEISPNVVYVKIQRFSGKVYKEFMDAIEPFADGKDDVSLILDLRDNPGGYLPETIKMLNQIFKEKGRLLVYTKDRSDKRIEYKTNGKRFYNIGQVAVLINGNSASASEIMAGAVQDWDRGVVIGQPSYGKGLGQEQYPLNNGGAIRLTVSKYYTPSGRLIQTPYENKNGNTFIDTSVYKTMVLEREVKASGGIFPDRMVNDTPLTNSETCKFALDYVHLFSLLNYDSNFDNPDQKELDQQFASFLQKQDSLKIDESLLCKSEIFEAIKADYIRHKSGIKEMYEYLNSDDPYIEEALDYIVNKNTLVDLLPEK